MSASFPRLMARVALLAALVASAASSYAQIPAASSARAIPTEVEQSEARVTQVIARAEDHLRKGKLNLEDSKREQARQEFDKAVDSILESGFDVRASQRSEERRVGKEGSRRGWRGDEMRERSEGERWQSVEGR